MSYVRNALSTRNRRHGRLRLLPLGRETVESLRQLRVGGSAPIPHLLRVLSRRHPSRLRRRLPQPARRLDAANGGRLARRKVQRSSFSSTARAKLGDPRAFDGRSPTAVLHFPGLCEWTPVSGGRSRPTAG